MAKAPIATEAVARIDQLFAIERLINGHGAAARLATRAASSAPILAELEPWLRVQREHTSRKSEIGKAIDYALKRWPALTRFMTDGRICLSNNAAERALRGIAVGRHNWTFAGSDRGGERAAAMYTLIETAKLNGVDPQAWLADVLARLPDHPVRRIADLLPGAAGGRSHPSPPEPITVAFNPRPPPDAYLLPRLADLLPPNRIVRCAVSRGLNSQYGYGPTSRPTIGLRLGRPRRNA